MQEYKINTFPASEKEKQREIIGTSHTAQMASISTIARVEAFCFNTVLQALQSAGLRPSDKIYEQINRSTAKLVIRNRKEIWTRYAQSKEGLKDWLLWKVGLRRNPSFEKMQRAGLTGDVLHDMEALKCLN